MIAGSDGAGSRGPKRLPGSSPGRGGGPDAGSRRATFWVARHGCRQGAARPGPDPAGLGGKPGWQALPRHGPGHGRIPPPVGRLEFVRQRQSMIVLAGDTGRVLAFGPGHRPGSSLPGDSGNSVISAHRDRVSSRCWRRSAWAISSRSRASDGRTLTYRVDRLDGSTSTILSVTEQRGIDRSPGWYLLALSRHHSRRAFALRGVCIPADRWILASRIRCPPPLKPPR